MEKVYTTEYQLLMDDPDVERCRLQGDKLQKQLWNDLGMSKVLCTGVGMNSDSTGPAIRVYLVDKADEVLVPKTFGLFEVLISITGGITT